MLSVSCSLPDKDLKISELFAKEYSKPSAAALHCSRGSRFLLFFHIKDLLSSVFFRKFARKNINNQTKV